MADGNISQITLPNGSIYNIKDTVSGYTTNTGTITKVQTTAGAHTTIDVSSGAAAFNVPTKTSHLTNDSGFITNAGVTGVKGNAESSYRTGQVNLTAANIGAVDKTGDTMTGNLTVPATKIANTYYGISFGRTTETPVETILYTGIKWLHGKHMPVIHITGYAYGLQSPVEFKIGFYLYGDPICKIGWCGVTNMGAWAPEVYLFKYTRDNIEYVAVGFKGSCYFLQLQADLQDEMGKFGYVETASNFWSWSFSTDAGVIPEADGGTTCIQVPYKANILNPTTINGYTVNANVPSGATFTDDKVYQSYKTASGYTYWRPLLIGYSSGSTDTFTPGDQTNLAYTFSTLKVQPSTGTIRVGNLALYNGNYTTTLTPTTLSANRTITVPDKAGTMALTSDITSAIEDLPEPMIFKGSVGTDGTITSLPTAAASNEGHTYKVITALSSPSAKVGDTVISNGTEWVVIPSGDEPSGTVTSVAAANATNGGLTISGSPITSSGTITIGHSNVLTSAQTTQAVYPIKIDKNGHISAYGSAVTIPTVPSATGSSTTGITIAAHGTGTVIGVQSTTTTASKVTVGSHSTDYGVKSAGSASTWTFEEKTIPNVTSAGTASSWTFEEKTIPNVTAAGSGSASLTFAMDTTDTKKLKITFSHTHTAPTIGTAIKVQSKSGGSNGTAPTLGTAITVQSKSGGANSIVPTLGSKVPTVSASDVDVPIKNSSASTFVTGTTHTITDNGHTHSI